MSKTTDGGEHISLSKFDTRILVTLLLGPSTGYGLTQKLHREGNIFYFASKGAVYPALAGLLKCGFIQAQEIGTTRSGRISRQYEITPTGRTVLEWEMTSIEQLVASYHRDR